MKNITNYTEEVFEKIKHIDEEGNEYWHARELMSALEYVKWQKFKEVISKAKLACTASGYNVSDHFTGSGKMVDIGSNTKRKVDDYKLTRYACYLISMNGASRKKVIALAQTYFAVQTRRQELLDEEYKFLSEDERRLKIRKQVKEGNYGLNRTAVKSGVKNLAEFHNAGYKGLYNGETADDIFKRKGLKYRQDILDNMGSEELAANLFRITQTDSKLKRDNVDNEYEANITHYKIGKKVRDTIRDLGSTMPEELPKPKSSIKEIDNKKT
jgi:DNA-damage-inducible protein D